jgi:hypothetical protein
MGFFRPLLCLPLYNASLAAGTVVDDHLSGFRAGKAHRHLAKDSLIASGVTYFALLSNEVNAPFEALSLYRSKDIVEKGFGNLKARLTFRRMQVSSELSLNGKLFVEFAPLIYLSNIKKKMQDPACSKNGRYRNSLMSWIPLNGLNPRNMGDCLAKSPKSRKLFLLAWV